MTVAAIAHHAAERPSAVAIVSNGVDISYAQLARNIGRFAQALEAMGLGPGSSAAVQCRDGHLHLLLLLACESLSVATASLVAGELETASPLLARVDLALTEHPERAAGAQRVQPLAKPWIDSVLALAPHAVPTPQRPGDFVRLIRTSGTTGQPKHVLCSRAAHSGRVAGWVVNEGIAPGHRKLVVDPFSVNTIYLGAAACLRAGATLYFEARISAAEAVHLHAITHLNTLPLQLRAILDRLPPGWSKPAGLHLSTFGGKLAGGLRNRAFALLADRIRSVYGSNETGTIAVAEGATGFDIVTVVRGSQVEIVDEDGKALAPGQAGRIRVQTPYMVDGYRDDPEATTRMFRDGWFYPGDVGILHEHGRLEVIGREDEILNLGGLKIAPEEIEETIRARAAVADAGACTLPNAEGVDELWIGAVYDAPDDRDIRARLRPALADLPYGHIHLAKLAAIPRTETGKVRRAELKRLMAEAQGIAGAVPLATDAPRGEAGRGGASDGE